jgi:hypothetical protein
MSAEKIHAQAVALVIDIHSILTSAFGPDLSGSARGELVSSHYLARIRDRMLGITLERPAQICASCIELRQRLVNIYHLTLTYHDPAATVRAVREASEPGAPAPGVSVLPEEWICVPCRERDVRARDVDPCCQNCGTNLEQRAALLAFLAPPAAPPVDLCEAEDA